MPNPTEAKRIAAAYAKIDKAKDELHALVAKLFPVGREIVWDKGGNYCYGEVLRVSRDDLYVKNWSTGKEYRISVWNIPGVWNAMFPNSPR